MEEEMEEDEWPDMGRGRGTRRRALQAINQSENLDTRRPKVL